MLDMFKSKYVWGVLIIVCFITFITSPGNHTLVEEKVEVNYKENLK